MPFTLLSRWANFLADSKPGKYCQSGIFLDFPPLDTHPVNQLAWNNPLFVDLSMLDRFGDTVGLVSPRSQTAKKGFSKKAV
jgi:hypothetical protein